MLILPIVLIATALRLWNIDQQWLWYDEIYAATFAAQPIIESLIAGLRFDLHPPLYYLQVNLWAIAGQGDVWLLLNSTLWSVAAVLSIFHTARRVFSREVALFSSLLLALLPTALLYAQQLRMYSMIMVFMIWAWYYNHRAVRENARASLLTAAAVFELLVAYSHATGFFMLVSVWSYGLLLMLQTAPAFRVLRRWLLAHIAVGLLCLPAVGNALVRSVSHTTAPNAAEILDTLLSFALGPVGAQASYAALFFLFVAGLLSWGAVVDRSARRILAAFLLAPTAATLLVTYLYSPIWHIRMFLFAVPFFALAMALALVGIAKVEPMRSIGRRWVAATVGGGLTAGFAVFAIIQATQFQKPHDFPELARFVAERFRPGDVVYVPEPQLFWGFSRYFIGPQWGSPLAVQDSIQTPQWQAIRAKLGEEWWHRLSLEPVAQAVTHDGMVVYVGDGAREQASEAKRIWLVSLDHEKAAEDISGGLKETSRAEFRGLLLLTLEKVK